MDGVNLVTVGDGNSTEVDRNRLGRRVGGWIVYSELVSGPGNKELGSYSRFSRQLDDNSQQIATPARSSNLASVCG